jgi:hypothetical protein
VTYDGFLDLVLEEKFVHWTLLPVLCRAKLSKEAYISLKKRLFSE